ncbi:MAG: RNA polymerase sigma factor [Planctomycetota bacterium]|jgi:RNA polymerase sigma-70 factor (ECF subfamily)
MEKTADYVRLIKKAQLGDNESLERLSELAEERLRVDMFRLTLQEDLAQEIVQESLIEMLRVLSDLKEAHRFWPWLYKIAINKMRLHYRTEKRRRTVTASAVAAREGYAGAEQAMAGAMSQELKDIILGAMRGLKPRHRTILTMRCYREMEYSQIAESMGCSEFAAKMLFYRAKRALRKQLSRFGFGRGLLAALVLFGRMTAPAEAAAQVSVSGAVMKVGVAAGVVGFATSTTGIISLAAAGVLTVGAATANLGTGPGKSYAGNGIVSGAQLSEQIAALDEGDEELWCYYPGSADGTVMMRLLRWDSRRNVPYCKWLQNERATYWFDEVRDTVHIRNHRIWRDDFGVWRLPADSAELSGFLSKVEGVVDSMKYYRGGGEGLLLISQGRQGDDIPHAIRHLNVLDEQYFLYGWPAKTRRLDDRDAMHKRGWTYFRIGGRIGDEEISGLGLVPFVDAARDQNGPWVRLRIGDGLDIADNGSEARIYRGGQLSGSYPGGSFFAGLSRPWMGLHTLDTVRRDAAASRIWFETHPGSDGKTVEVVLTRGERQLIFVIDMDKDIIEKIFIESGDRRDGELVFSYLDDVKVVEKEFIRPTWRSSGGRHRQSPGIIWLMNLGDGES